MPIFVEHDQAHDRLHIVLQRDRLIIAGEWLAQNAEIGLAFDRSPVEICVYGYYTEPKSWPLTPELVERYGLGEWLEDLRLVWTRFFAPPEYAVKAISFEGPDGEEVVIRPGQVSN